MRRQKLHRALEESDAKATQAARRHRAAKLACAAVAAWLTPGRPALATIDTWAGVTGNWSDNAGWALGVPPGNGDSAFITNLAGAAATLTFDATGTATNLAQLTIDNTAGGSITLLQVDGILTSATTIIGHGGSGAVTQSGGTQTAGNLYLGFLTAGASGTFNLGGSASSSPSLAVLGAEALGYNGIGIFNQTGGSHSIGGTLFLGINDGSAGIFNQSGGTTTVGGDLYLGWIGASSSGTLNLSGAAVLSVAGREYIGNASTGAVNQIGGSSHSIGGTLYIGNMAGTTGAYDLGNSASLAVTGSEFLGHLGAGTFNQTGGTHTVEGNFYLAFTGAASSGLYGLSGSSSSLNVKGTEILGYNGTATFNHSGGSHTAGSLVIAVNPGSSATYNLSDSASLTVTDAESIGLNGGTGQFNQTGGSHSVGGMLTVTANPASTAVYNLSCGTLTASVVNRGTFMQSGGVFNGTLNNYADFNYDGGIFAGALVIEPSAKVNFAMPFTAGGGITVVNNTISVLSTATLTANGAGLNNQGGTIHLAGGSIRGDGPIRNSGSISGNGTFATAGVINAPDGTVMIGDGSTSFTGEFINNGSFQITNGSVVFSAGFTNNNSYTSDPSTNSFADLSNGPGGFIQAADGDIFVLTGSFHSSSTQNTKWKTASAALHIQGDANSPSHEVDITGANVGMTLSGYADNFAWGTLEVDPNQSLVLRDGNATPDGALYAGVVQLLGAPADSALYEYIAAHITNADPANPMSIYYDQSLAGNAYLNDLIYPLGNGGVLSPIAIPDPASLGIVVLGGLGLLSRRIRRGRPIAR